VGSPRQCADFAGQWREELLVSIWTSGLTECHLSVKSDVLTVGRSLPVYPDKQTFSGSVGMSQRCQFRKPAGLFDHFVGAGEQRLGNIQTQRLGRL
jgi:hypothetical protein